MPRRCGSSELWRSLHQKLISHNDLGLVPLQIGFHDEALPHLEIGLKRGDGLPVSPNGHESDQDEA